MEEDNRTEFTNKEIIIFITYMLLFMIWGMSFLSSIYVQLVAPLDIRIFITVMLDICLVVLFVIDHLPKKYTSIIFEDVFTYHKYVLVCRIFLIIFVIIPNVMYWEIAKTTPFMIF